MLPADIAIAVTRLKLVDSSEASLLGMARDVERAAELLADAGVGIVVFHCTAGKDRTGILCALTHHIAGVHHDDIIADYLLTNDEERFARRLPLFAAHVEELTGRRPSDEAMRTTMGVEAEYLDRAFEAMRRENGGLDGYLREALGVDAARRAAVERRILL
eukprot:gene581-766_t